MVGAIGRIGPIGRTGHGRDEAAGRPRTVWDFEGGDPGPLRAFARTGAGTAFTLDGRLAVFGPDTPRITDNGLLLEPAAANHLARYAPTASQFSHNVSAADVPEPSDPPLAGLNWVAVDNTSAVAAAYQPATYASGLRYILSCLIETPDESPPLVGHNSANFELSLVMQGGLSASISIRRLSGRVWLVKGAYVAPANAGFNTGIVRYVGQSKRPLKFSGFDLQQAGADWGTSPIITTGAPATRGADEARLTVPEGRTTWRAVYGDDRSEAGGSGLVPGEAFDLVTGRPWIGPGRELKRVAFL